MQVPKPKRVTNPKLLKAIRQRYCEVCGRDTDDLGVHHIISRGSGGADAPCNLITLCPTCHTKAHAGNVRKSALWAVVAKRENITPEEAEETAYALRRGAV